MAAENKDFPWMSHSGEYGFFESKMLVHDKVLKVMNVGDGLYDVEISSGKTLRVFICECYSFGCAEFHESVQKLGQLDVVIINSLWCGYTMEAKRHCRTIKVGLFTIGGFMAALNLKEYWNYLTKAERESLYS